ncbi:hypothetical protein [Pleurocapsa sp. CCALA 161]|uniref:hypothetical protein n=1 Tax=Pleurocapsa sp. CCALA 161 TaxID=2107688 RepID=UPI0011B20A3E|nr:hypothetical protein [Pleurocapsa sp. CCALA 161]
MVKPAPLRPPGTMSRPRLKGKRLPNLEQILLNTDTQWSNVTLSHWYGESERQVEVTTGLAVMHCQNSRNSARSP